MTTIIQLPYFPFVEPNKEGKFPQVDRIKQILGKARDRGYNVGVQVYSGRSDNLIKFEEGEKPDEWLPRLYEQIGEDMWDYSTLHFPICPHLPDRRMNLGKPEDALEFHEKFLKAAQDSGLKRLILHPNTVYYVDSEKSKDKPRDLIWSEKTRREALGFLDLALELAEKFPKLHFAYENMPFPLHGDHFVDPREVNVEPNLITIQSIMSFFSRTKKIQNIGLCLDTAHYIIAKKTIDYIRENPKLLFDTTIRTLIGSLDTNSGFKPSEDDTRKILEQIAMPSLVDFVKKYFDRITDVQIADTLGAWMPSVGAFKSRLIKEGLPLEKGKNHYDDIFNILLFLKESSGDKEVTASIDVWEKDFVARENQEKTLLEVLRKI